MRASIVIRSMFAVMSAAGALGACSAGTDGGSPGNGAPQGNEDTGTVGLSLQLAPGITVATVSYTITGPHSFSRTGTIDVSHSPAISAVIAGIPSGSGYVVTLTAVSTDGSVTCAGTSAPFTVSAGHTTAVSVTLLCSLAGPDAGSISIGATPVGCPTIDGVSISPTSVFVGGTVSLAVAASAPVSSALAYSWSTTSGSLANASSDAPTLTCTAVGMPTVTVTVSDGSDAAGCIATQTLNVTCLQPLEAGASDAGSTDATVTPDASDAGAPPPPPPQALFTTVDPGVVPATSIINQGTAIGEGAQNGATPSTLTNVAADPNNTSSLVVTDAGAFLATGHVPDTAAGFCDYSGATPKRISYVTGAKFETAGPDGGPGTDPMVPMAPFYFPLVYTTTNTPTPNAFGGQPPIIGLFDWRPKDIDEAVVVAESDDFGKTWYFMQTVLELNPDYTNPISGGYSPTATSTGCPTTITSTNANFVSANGSQADDGWGHAAIIQLPGPGNVKTGQFLYLLDRNTNNIPGTNNEIVDNAPLHVINITGSSNKFPIWNTNNTSPGNNDIKSISSALSPTVDGGANLVTVQSTNGLLNPDGIMAVFPTPATAAAGSPVTVLYVQKILNGDNTGPTAMPVAQQCKAAPFSGKTNHDIANVRLATTTDGVNFTDLGIVQGLNDPTTVDYNQTRWVSPRATLLDINGDGSLWGMYFSAGNCLDGDSDAFHYIGYAESADKVHWTVYNDINHPIASINPITVANQAGGAIVTIPANPPLIPTQAWFAERLYAPTAARIDATHLSLTFAGYGVQTPNNDLLDYRQIGNVVLTVSKPLPAGVPNNINTH